MRQYILYSPIFVVIVQAVANSFGDNQPADDSELRQKIQKGKTHGQTPGPYTDHQFESVLLDEVSRLRLAQDNQIGFIYDKQQTLHNDLEDLDDLLTETAEECDGAVLRIVANIQIMAEEMSSVSVALTQIGAVGTDGGVISIQGNTVAQISNNEGAP